jgi:hypothetical protein
MCAASTENFRSTFVTSCPASLAKQQGSFGFDRKIWFENMELSSETHISVQLSTSSNDTNSSPNNTDRSRREKSIAPNPTRRSWAKVMATNSESRSMKLEVARPEFPRQKTNSESQRPTTLKKYDHRYLYYHEKSIHASSMDALHQTLLSITQ